MTRNKEDVRGAGSLRDAGVQQAFGAVQRSIVIFGVVGVILLATLALIASAGGEVSTFMWVRASILLVITPLFYRLAVRASQGVRKDFERLRTVTLVVPIAVIVVDLIPGVCPAWYAAIQAVSALALVAAAVITRHRALSAVFPKGA